MIPSEVKAILLDNLEQMLCYHNNMLHGCTPQHRQEMKQNLDDCKMAIAWLEQQRVSDENQQ